MQPFHASLLVIVFLGRLSCGTIGDPPALFQYQNCWSTAASTGIADETARDHLIYGFPPDPNVIAPENPFPVPETLNMDAMITLDQRSPAGIYQIRYPLNQQFIFLRIVGPDDFTYAANLRARYRVIDQEKSAVRVFLKRYPLEPTGGIERSEIILQIDSDDFAASDRFQTQSAFNGAVLLDFSRFSYYVDVHLVNKMQSGDVPELPMQSRSPAIANLAVCRGGGPAID
ncbi:MAG: hypothetical protein HKN76_18710 [Saprospiraceae bacterium]|nr:hypothetical protein [Saprospiraceae bacterium]